MDGSLDTETGDEEPIYTGSQDDAGHPHGRGTLTFPSGDQFQGHFVHGDKQGRGSFVFADGSSLSGQFESDGLEGAGIYSYPDGGWLEGIYKDGELNGPAREYSAEGKPVFEGSYEGNVRTGHCWVYHQDGGSIVGQVDRHGALTGPNIAYIYPDRIQGIVGIFRDGVLVRGRPVHILPHPHNGTPRFQLARKGGAKAANVPVYKRDVSTETVLSKQPLVTDEYESSRVYVKASLIPGAGEGLFAIVDAQADQVMSFYNGIKVSHTQVDTRDWTENSNTISLDEEWVIDVPEEYVSTSVYCASLGHKANHSFTPNSKYDTFDHPRFGPIKCIRTIRSVQAHDELTVFYGYQHEGEAPGDTAAPQWYLDQQRQHLLQLRK